MHKSPDDPVFYATPASPSALAVADFDGDGDYNSRDVSVLANHGDGTFAQEVTYPAGSFPVDLTQADFDGDQWPHLAVADRDGSAAQVLLNDGSGAYPAVSAVGVGAGPPASRPEISTATRVRTWSCSGPRASSSPFVSRRNPVATRCSSPEC